MAPGRRARKDRFKVFIGCAIGSVLLSILVFTDEESNPNPDDRLAGGILMLVVALAFVGAAVWQRRALRAAPPSPSTPAPAAPAGARPPHLEPTLLAQWQEVRPDALGPAPYDRYAAWAEPKGDLVELQLLRCAPTSERLEPAHFAALERRIVRTVDPTSIEDAAAAMAKLREDAARREEEARAAQADAASAAEQAARDAALRKVDAAAEQYQREREQEMLRQLAAEEAQERRTQAEVVAEALRRP